MTRLPKIIIGSIAAILLLLALMFVAPFTDTGIRLGVALLNHFAPLQLEYESGNLLSRVKLKRIELEADGFVLKLDQVSAALEISCLWNSILCFSDLQADKVAAHWAGGQWHNGAVRARILLSESRVVVEELELQNVDFALQTSTQDDDSSPDMPEVSLPLALIIKQLIIHHTHWQVGEAAAQHDLITAQGSWIDEHLKLAEVAISSKDIGVFALSGQLVSGGEWPFQLEAKAQWDDAFTPADFIDLPKYLEKTVLHTPWLLSADGTAANQSFSISGVVEGGGYDSLELFVQGEHTVGEINPGESQLQISRLELNHRVSDSHLNAEADVTLGDHGHTNFLINSSGFTLPAMAGGLTGRLSGLVTGKASFSASAWGLAIDKIDLTGKVNDLPAQAHGNFEINQDLQISNTQLSAELNGAHVILSAMQSNTDTAELNLTVDDLGLWLSGSRGRVETSGAFTAGLGALQFSGGVQGFKWQTIAFDDSQLTGTVSLENNFPFAATVTASAIAVDSISLDTMQLKVSGDKIKQSARLRSTGGVDGLMQLKGRTTTEGWQGALDTTRINTPAGSWQLERKLTLGWQTASSQFSVDSHCWLTADAQVCPDRFELALVGDSTTATGGVTFAGGLSVLSSFMPPGYATRSNITLDTKFNWDSVAGLALSGELQLQEGELSKTLLDEESASFYWDSGYLRFNYDKGAANLAATLSQHGVDIIAANVVLPGLKTQALSGDINLTQFQLQSIEPFVGGIKSLSGYMNGRLSLSGTAEHPQGRGQLNVTEGDFTASAMPAEIKSLELQIDLQGNRALVAGGANVGGGQMDIIGSVQYDPLLRAELQLVGRQESLIFPPSVQVKVSHDLNLSASPDFLAITGELRVHEGELKYESLPQGGVDLSQDVVTVNYMGRGQERSAAFDTAINVQVDIDDKFKISGSVADVTVGGELQLLQKKNHPLQLFGNLNVLGGELRAYRQSLKVKRGSVSFAGAPDNPSLDMRATRDISTDNVTVGMELTGTLESPVLGVFSDPVMPQTETLSYLMRGRGLDTGAAADGAAMALSMGSTLLNESGVFNTLNQLPGINGVELSTEGSEKDTAATIGGYIGQRIYLSYGVGLYEPINVLTARLYLKTRLWLEVVSSLENSLDIYYSFDID